MISIHPHPARCHHASAASTSRRFRTGRLPHACGPTGTVRGTLLAARSDTRRARAAASQPESSHPASRSHIRNELPGTFRGGIPATGGENSDSLSPRQERVYPRGVTGATPVRGTPAWRRLARDLPGATARLATARDAHARKTPCFFRPGGFDRPAPQRPLFLGVLFRRGPRVFAGEASPLADRRSSAREVSFDSLPLLWRVLVRQHDAGGYHGRRHLV